MSETRVKQDPRVDRVAELKAMLPRLRGVMRHYPDRAVGLTDVRRTDSGTVWVEVYEDNAFRWERAENLRLILWRGAKETVRLTLHDGRAMLFTQNWYAPTPDTEGGYGVTWAKWEGPGRDTQIVYGIPMLAAQSAQRVLGLMGIESEVGKETDEELEQEVFAY